MFFRNVGVQIKKILKSPVASGSFWSECFYWILNCWLLFFFTGSELRTKMKWSDLFIVLPLGHSSITSARNGFSENDFEIDPIEDVSIISFMGIFMYRANYHLSQCSCCCLKSLKILSRILSSAKELKFRV